MKSHEMALKRPEQRLWMRWLERAALAVLALHFALNPMERAWRSLITDFPNYYLAAQIARQGFDTSRMYEWQWLEREKDHRAIPIRIIGLVPITPFSTLFVWPLTGLKPLIAKRVWILGSLALLIPVSWMLRQMTYLSYARIALIFALSVPLYRNIEFGQFYVVLLMMIVAACWCYLRGWHALSGALIAVAAASKIFPLIFFVFFLQRRAWRALVSGMITGAATMALSIGVFGWNVHRTYFREILPATLHGEVLPPYAANASLSGILHVLFLPEPQWNPRPWLSSVPAYSILLPLLSILVIAPAILLIAKHENSEKRTLLEWSALLTAALAISTVPASYNFVLIVLPVCVAGAILLEQKRYAWVGALLIAYIGIGFPVPVPDHVQGPAIFIYTPRLLFLFALLAGIYVMLRAETTGFRTRDWTRFVWAALMAVWLAFTIHSTWLRETAVRREFAFEVPIEQQGFLNEYAHAEGNELRFISFRRDGYHLMTANGARPATALARDPSDDDLSWTSDNDDLLIERAAAPESVIVRPEDLSQPVLRNAEDPLMSAKGETLAFLRGDHGRKTLMVHSLFGSPGGADRALTSPALDVYEATFLSESEYAFAASAGSEPPQIFLTDATHRNAPIGLKESRYPALSPDGAWLAYSRMDGGFWNLWLRNQRTGVSRRIGDVPCNEIQPLWRADSKSILYGTDCGRSFWFTAIAQRRLIP